MSMFTLTISCLTTSNLPWFMDLTLQVPMQYCSLQLWTLLLSPVISTVELCSHFGSISSFFLELFLYSSQVAYGAPTDMGSSSFSVISFCLSIVFLGFSRREYWSGLPFPSPGDHVLSEHSTMTHPFWVAPYDMAHSFVELDKAVVHVISLISFLWLWFSFCPLLWEEAYGSFLMGKTDWGKLSLVLMGRAMLHKSLVQFSVDGLICVPSLLFNLRPNYGGGNQDNGNLLLKVPCMHCCTQCPYPCSRPPPTHASAGASWTLTS